MDKRLSEAISKSNFVNPDIEYYYYGKFFKNEFHIKLSLDNEIKITTLFEKYERKSKKFKIDNTFKDFIIKNYPYYFGKGTSTFGIEWFFTIFRKNYMVIVTYEVDTQEEYRLKLGDTIEVHTDDDEYIFNDLIEDISHLNFVENAKNPIYYKYVTVSNTGFDSVLLKIKSNYNVNLSEQFNSDLPLVDLERFIKKESCGLTLFHGKPGTGKTTMIKNLIYKYGEDYDFFVLDASLLGNITSASFIQYLLNNSDSIFILEDCEKLLIDRERTNNPWVGTLLNLTDGILGESLRIKFICTFNSDLNSIDKALLREGRLDILYEFKPLEEDKAKILCDKLGKEYRKNITLAEIYKSKVVNSKLTKEQTKIGF